MDKDTDQEAHHGLSQTESFTSTSRSYPTEHLRLSSGSLFRIRRNHAYLSHDEGTSWTRRGKVNPYPDSISRMLFDDIAIQLQKGEHRGRIVAPFYLEMDGEHPDYTREARGGHAVWKGQRRLIETHTYVPEMAGSFMRYSDDEGKTWNSSKGFLMGYFQDGHCGHWSCEEPVIAELKNGGILCLMRSTTGRLLKSFSGDGGVSWTKVESTDIACSNSPAMLKRIPATADLVLVWNQVSGNEIRNGYRRGRLSIATSPDDGLSWRNYRTLELVSGLDAGSRIDPEPLQAMVRGPSDKGLLPDDYAYYDYPNVYFWQEKIVIAYRVGYVDGRSVIKTKEITITGLYE